MVCPRPLIRLQVELWHVACQEAGVGTNLSLRKLSETSFWLIINTKERAKQSVAFAASIGISKNGLSSVKEVPNNLLLMQLLDQGSILNGRFGLLAAKSEGAGLRGNVSQEPRLQGISASFYQNGLSQSKSSQASVKKSQGYHRN